MQVAEGNAGTKVMTFTLTRADGTAAFDVNFATANGTAIAGEDFVAASGIVRFAAGETQKTVSVTINGDTKFEDQRRPSTSISRTPPMAPRLPTACQSARSRTTTFSPSRVRSSIGDQAIVEGNAGTKVLTFTLTRSGGTAAFDVNFATANGTAIAGEDYVAASGIVRFAAGETQKTVSVTINGDAKFEGNETFNVNLSNATNGATIADGIAIGTITNDDVNRAPTVTSTNVTLAGGASVAVSSIFAAQDLDGNSTITKYAFWDAGNGGGFFTVNGVAQASGQWIQVDAANLGNVRYVGGVNGGVETAVGDRVRRQCLVGEQVGCRDHASARPDGLQQRRQQRHPVPQQQRRGRDVADGRDEGHRQCRRRHARPRAGMRWMPSTSTATASPTSCGTTTTARCSSGR